MTMYLKLHIKPDSSVIEITGTYKEEQEANDVLHLLSNYSKSLVKSIINFKAPNTSI